MRKLSPKLTVKVTARKITTVGQQACLDPPLLSGGCSEQPQVSRASPVSASPGFEGIQGCLIAVRSSELHKNAAGSLPLALK